MEKYFDLQNMLSVVMAYLPKVIGAILTIIIGFWVAKVVSKLIGKALSKNNVDIGVQKFLSSLVSTGIKIMTLIAAAGMFGFETTSFVAIISALAFSVGLALQGSLGHFASGVLLLIFKPFKTGDLVEVGGGKTGTVCDIQIFNTVLETLDNKRVIIPNGVITSNVITNISGQGTIGVELSYKIGHENKIEVVRKIICDVADSCPYILKDPKTTVSVASLDDNMVKVATRPFCKSENYWDTYFYMNEGVKNAFDKAGIKMPTPGMNIHLNKE